MIKRGQLWWVDLGEPQGSEPGYRRPVLVLQENTFNKSKLATVDKIWLDEKIHTLDVKIMKQVDSSLKLIFAF